MAKFSAIPAEPLGAPKTSRDCPGDDGRVFCVEIVGGMGSQQRIGSNASMVRGG